ncbi:MULTISPECIES: DUF2937 family protein [unclassified Aureimonas]|uniref:DUF2937 family protein n=1 Tax=unclassified Aureimonas TaxID=2615206 RepID=UPI0006F65389|nr:MULTISPECIES: DUF2937 family protein [unclassified Aureimonas]KQT64299.1 hypothetical protein ASG62_04745 [Aureimonas sp. Leaf427]KQT81488.1 hypothetical protein ASG54_02010 [Aureimonas sp. Leaf460]
MDLVLRVVGAVLSGFLFSQSAEFTQQYLQRLGGARDELRAVVERFDASAATAGLSRGEAVDQLKGGADAFVARQGSDAAETISRYEDVSRRYLDLTGSAPLFRPFVLASDPDGAILSGVAGDYRPALPTTPDGLALTLAGLGGGWALGAGAAVGVRRRRRRRGITAANARG